jgi:hypothetical protein
VENLGKSQGWPSGSPQATSVTINDMAFEVTLTDDTTEQVDGADSYTLEGPLTTFFGNDRPRPLDSWSTKVASYRTERIAKIRRLP